MNYIYTKETKVEERIANLVPWVCFNLRKLKFIVVGIHAPYFFSGWCSQDLQHTTKLRLKGKTKKVDTKFEEKAYKAKGSGR